MSETLSENQKFYQLQALVCDKLPFYAASLTVNAGYPAPLSRLQAVKAGKTKSLPDLVALVKHSLPDFEIPAHLRPEVPAPQQVPA